jgi:hypothetical protein
MNTTDHRFVLSVDIADASDYTALVILHGYSERHGNGEHATRYDLVHAERFRGIGYPEQTERIRDRFRELERYASGTFPTSTATLLLDETGVGRPVRDMLHAAGLHPRGVLITGGDKATTEGSSDRVPKKELASALQVALQSKQLRIAEELPLAPLLIKELEGFRVKITLSGHATFGNDVGAAPWRTADHDDLVLATAIGVWALHYRRVATIPRVRVLY